MQLRTEVEIEADPGHVWSVLTDFGAYKDWNPFIGSVKGALAVGERLRLEVSPSGSQNLSLRARVTVVNAERELAWRVSHMPVPGLLDGVHFYRLSATDGGGTRLVQGEDFSGILLSTVGSSLTNIARAFVAMNQALRDRVLALGPRP